MEVYLDWVLLLQSKTDPHNQDIRSEPKFLIPSVIKLQSFYIIDSKLF